MSELVWDFKCPNCEKEGTATHRMPGLVCTDCGQAEYVYTPKVPQGEDEI